MYQTIKTEKGIPLKWQLVAFEFWFIRGAFLRDSDVACVLSLPTSAFICMLLVLGVKGLAEGFVVCFTEYGTVFFSSS